MRQRYSRLICGILVIIMTFTGMCMDTEHADSFLASSTLSDHSKVHIAADNNTVTSETVCTQRMLGISEFTFINRAIDHRNVRQKMRSSLTPIIMKLSARRFTNLHMAEEDLNFSKKCLSAIVLNYIHKKDGKK